MNSKICHNYGSDHIKEPYAMSLQRFKELYDLMLGYITEMLNGIELVEVLRNIGFTDEEIAYEGFEIEEEI